VSEPKKISRRVAGPAKAVARPGSNRFAKPVSKRQEVQTADDAEPDAPISDEPLFEDGDVTVLKTKAPIETDQSLVSEDTLYSEEDEDPKEKLRDIQQKSNSQRLAAAKEKEKTGSRSNMSPVKHATTSGSDWIKTPDPDAETVEEDLTDTVEEAPDEEPEEKRTGSRSKMKSASSQRLKDAPRSGGSRRAVKMDDDTSRSGRKSVRSSGPGKLFLTTRNKVLLGVGTVLVLAVVIGYGPAIRFYHTKNLDEGATVDVRKNAADALFDCYKDTPSGIGSVYGIYAVRLSPANPELREAAVYGLELVGSHPAGREIALRKIAEEMPTADAAGKTVYIRALKIIAKPLADKAMLNLSKPDADAALSIAKTLLSVLEISSKPQEPLPFDVRVAAVDAVSTLIVPGVSKSLLTLAKTEKGELRDKARKGFIATALPDVAGELLETMVGDDKELATEAKRSFGRIRTETKSELLLPLVTHPRDDVRKEIVDALGARTGDTKAAQGITAALSDKLAEIRVLAVKAILKTGISGPSTQLSALVSDPEEAVRIANAETLAQLRDPESKTVILGAFQKNLEGKSLEAYITALGKRFGGKDIASIGMVIGLLDANPAAETSMKQALILLSLNGQERRRAQRANWTAENWKTWFAKIKERESMRAGAIKKLEAIREQRNADRAIWARLSKEAETNLDILEKCVEMCKPDDMEDVAVLDVDMKKYTTVKEYFFKGASVDVRR